MSSNKKVILITGANTGLGYEATKALYNSSTPYELIIGSRKLQSGEDAISKLRSESPNSKSSLSAVQIDVCSDESIEKCVKHVEHRFSRLDTLVNNAGASFDLVMASGKLSVREGWNLAWDTNVTGTHIITNSFIPLLLKSSDPRLIFITSGTSPLEETMDPESRINQSPPAGWPKQQSPNPIMSYRSSKTGMNMMMRGWYLILKNDGVKVWCISPGFLATGLGGVAKEILQKMGALEPHIGGEFIRDVVQGQRDKDVGLCIRKDSIQPW